MIRSIMAVLVGYFVVAFLIAVTFLIVAAVMFGGMPGPGQAPVMPPIGVQAALLVASALFAVVGGYVAAWVARRAEIGHALALGGVMLVLSASMFMPGHPEPLWFKLVTIGMTVPAPLLGGWLRKKLRAP